MIMRSDLEDVSAGNSSMNNQLLDRLHAQEDKYDTVTRKIRDELAGDIRAQLQRLDEVGKKAD